MDIKTKPPFDMEDVLIALRDNSITSRIFRQTIEKRDMLSVDKIAHILILNEMQKRGVHDMTDFGLLRDHIILALRILPQQTIDRNHIRRWSIKDTHWFRKGYTHNTINNMGTFLYGPLTSVREEAASEYSLPWGCTDFIDSNPYTSHITMYVAIDTFAVSALKLYEMYTALHELGHVHCDAAYYSLYYAKTFLNITEMSDKHNAYMLTLPDNTKISGNRYVSNFATLLEKHGPFGTYTAGYVKQVDEDLWLREGFADATAAYFMGFMMYPEKDFAPLHPDVWEYMHNFYHATAEIK